MVPPHPPSYYLCWCQRNSSHAAYPNIPIPGYNQGLFCTMALPWVNRRRYQTTGTPPSKGDTALLPSHIVKCSAMPVLNKHPPKKANQHYVPPLIPLNGLWRWALCPELPQEKEEAGTLSAKAQQKHGTATDTKIFIFIYLTMKDNEVHCGWRRSHRAGRPYCHDHPGVNQVQKPQHL